MLWGVAFGIDGGYTPSGPSPHQQQIRAHQAPAILRCAFATLPPCDPSLSPTCCSPASWGSWSLWRSATPFPSSPPPTRCARLLHSGRDCCPDRPSPPGNLGGGEDDTDTDHGISLGIRGEPHARLHLTPQGQVLTGDGQTPPTDQAGSALYTPLPMAWVAPTLLNSWVDFGLGYQGLRYRKFSDVVEIQGMIKGGTAGSTIFVLPAGFRPANNVIMGGVLSSDQQSPRLNIGTDGSVAIDFTAFDVTSWAALSLRFAV